MKALWKFDRMVQKLRFLMLSGDSRVVRKIEAHIHSLKKQGMYLRFHSMEETFAEYEQTVDKLDDVNEHMEEALHEMDAVLKNKNHSFDEWNSLNKKLQGLFKTYNEETQRQKKQVSFLLYLSKQYLIQKAVLDSKEVEDKRAVLGGRREKTYAEIIEESIALKKEAHGRSLETIASLNAEILQILSQGESSDLTMALTEKTNTLQEEMKVCEQLRDELYEAETADNRLAALQDDGLAYLQLDVSENMKWKKLVKFKETMLAVGQHPLSGKWVDGNIFNEKDKEVAHSLNETFQSLLEEPNKKILA